MGSCSRASDTFGEFTDSVRLVEADGDGGHPVVRPPPEVEMGAVLVSRETCQPDGLPVHGPRDPREVTRGMSAGQHDGPVGEAHPDRAVARRLPDGADRDLTVDELGEPGAEEDPELVGVGSAHPVERGIEVRQVTVDGGTPSGKRRRRRAPPAQADGAQAADDQDEQEKPGTHAPSVRVDLPACHHLWAESGPGSAPQSRVSLR